MQQDLIVDPAIRDWVLGPLTIILLLSGLVRHYVTMLLNTPPKAEPMLVVREQRALARGLVLRTHASYLPPSSFLALKTHLSSAYTSGAYLKAAPPAEGEKAPPPPNPLTDPGAMDGMTGMLKKQAVSFLPQTVLMYYIGYFYNGFVLTRLPFPLTLRFKSMLQRGIETADMDVTWVSSVSWYFLCLFGLNSVYQLLLGEENAADSGPNAAAMNPMAGMMGAGQAMPGAPAQDFVKLFKTENENLEIVEYSWVCDGVEERLLKKYQ
ncbi:transmembrane protein [Meredithblackwellia eburnea MCA 4105]